jgi:endonuclease YncB( thermonuclease family)
VLARNLSCTGIPSTKESVALSSGESPVSASSIYTIVVSPNEKVRLIGVDTPETADRRGGRLFGKEANSSPAMPWTGKRSD